MAYGDAAPCHCELSEGWPDAFIPAPLEGVLRPHHDNPSVQGVPDELVGLLVGQVWHATIDTRVPALISEGIRHDRDPIWARHADTCARALGGVSVFDFRALDRLALARESRQHDPWTAWLGPQQTGAPARVWFRLDAYRLPGPLLSPGEMWKTWLERKRGRPPIAQDDHNSTGVEGCYIGVVPPDCLADGFIVCSQDHGRWQRFASLDALAELLPGFVAGCPSVPIPVDVNRDPQRGK